MPKSNVDYWETDDVIYSESRDVGSTNFSVTAEISHPMYVDGGEGRPRLGVTVRRSLAVREFFMRLMCPDGSVEEIRIVRDLLDSFLNREEEAIKKLKFHNEIWNENRIKEHNCWSSAQAGNNNRNKDAGTGLGRFSKPGKTERRRDKKKSPTDVQ